MEETASVMLRLSNANKVFSHKNESKQWYIFKSFESKLVLKNLMSAPQKNSPDLLP